MATSVILPKVDMDQESGTIVEWLKQDGEAVEKGESILIIETSKVAMEVESPASGILRIVQGEAGEDIHIGTVIAYVLKPGEELPEETVTTVPKDAPPPPLLPAATAAPAAGVLATPAARRIAASTGVDLAGLTGTGPHGKVTKRDVQAALTAVAGERTGAGQAYATPAARRTARGRGIDLTTVSGSGPQGRIQAADVLAAAAAQVDGAPASVPEAAPVPEVERRIDVRVIPLEGMRRTIAERMTASYQTAPHITLTVRVDMSAFEEARASLNARTGAAGQPRVSVTALLLKAVAWALKGHSLLNSRLQDDGVHLLPEINVGVAVALMEGLIVPVVRNADQKDVGEIASEVHDLAVRAREGQLTPADVAGGTFTVSNLGPFGIEQFTAIINPPQAAILAVGATQREAVVSEEDQIVVRPALRMTLSADHRIVDGAVAARFLTDLQGALEVPTSLLW